MNREYAEKCLAVDSDIENAKLYVFEWAEHNVKMDRADDMAEAIQHLLSFNDYIFVGINGDAVDFMPLLKKMRSITNTQIMIVTSDFTTEKEIAALENGADLYARWHKNPKGNVASVLAHIARTSERAKQYKPLTNILSRTRSNILSCDCLGDLIKSARKFKNMTQAELAAKLQISARHLKAIENEDKKPSFNLLERIVSELEITDIMLDTDNEILHICAGKNK